MAPRTLRSRKPPCPAQEAPEGVLEVGPIGARPEAVGSPHVLVVHHVLLEVDEGAQTRDREGAERRAVAHAVDQGAVARGLRLLHEALRARREAPAEQDARAGRGVALAHHEVGGQVLGGPALAEGGRVGTELLEQVAELAALAGVEGLGSRSWHGR